ncbi:hypothetical protein [Hyphococcus sp.]|uniref:hypothetical protein n=1 Tax=Hyphococcus sp. TaxID=2038636 RepID=UPI003CCC0196
MAAGGKHEKSGMLDAMRESAQAALKHLAPAPSLTAAPEDAAAETLSFTDPTRALFPGANMGERQADELSFSLDQRLAGSADSVARREAMLAQDAMDLKNVSDARAAGEKSLTIWGLRFLIGAAWLAIGFWLNQTALYARANDLPTAFAGVLVADAGPLAYAFVIAGAAGAGFAVLMIAYVFISGNATNTKLRRQAERFGDRLAQEARALTASLKTYRDKVVSSDSGGGVSAASQAHLAALEAAYFFRNIAFLTTIDHRAADDSYRNFLRRYCPPGAGFSFAEMVLMGIFGSLVGLAAGWKTFRAGPAEPVETGALAIMQYPWAAQILVFGGLAYLLTGVAIELLSGAIGAREMTAARKDALDSMRSAYTAQEAPLESEVVRQVEDVVAILTARLGGKAPGKTNQSAAFTGGEAEPDWRRRDSSVKFVETGFTGAPERWRTDAYAKKFEAADRRKPGAKREPKRP